MALHPDESGELSGFSSCLCDCCHPTVTFPISNLNGGPDDFTSDDGPQCQVLRVVQLHFGPIYGKIPDRFNEGKQEKVRAKESSKADVRNENSLSSILFPSSAKLRSGKKGVSLGRTNAECPDQSPDHRPEMHRYQQQYVSRFRQTHGCHTNHAGPECRHSSPVAHSKAPKDTEVNRSAQDSFWRATCRKHWYWLVCIAICACYIAQSACCKKTLVNPSTSKLLRAGFSLFVSLQLFRQCTPYTPSGIFAEGGKDVSLVGYERLTLNPVSYCFQSTDDSDSLFVCCPFVVVEVRASTRLFDFYGFLHNHQKSRCKEIHTMHLQEEPLLSQCRPHRKWIFAPWTYHKVSIKHCWKNRILYGYSLFSRYFIPCLGFPGEGPDFTFASINLNSCQSNFYSAVNLSEFSDSLSLVCAQETRIPPHKTRRLARNFKSYGWDLTLGPQPSFKRLAGIHIRKGLRQKHGGVASFANDRCAVTPIEIPKRFVVGDFVQAFHCVSSDFVCIIVNVYLPSGPHRKRERERHVSDLFDFVATLGECPIFVCGDFQMNASHSKILSSALASGEWSDIASQIAHAHGQEPQPTFVQNRRSKAIATRIDCCFGNSQAMTFVKNAWVVPDAGFPDHRPLFVELSIPDSVDRVFQLRHCPTWSFPPRPTTESGWEERDRICQPVLAATMEELTASAAALDAEKTWEIACRIVHDMLQALACEPISTTKGNIPHFISKPVIRKPKALSTRARRIAKATALFRELLAKCKNRPENPTFSWRNHFNNTKRNLGRILSLLEFPDTIQEDLYDLTRLQICFAQFQKQIHQQDLQFSNKAIAKWKKKMAISSRADRKDIHRWLKSGYTKLPKIMTTPEGSITGNVSAILHSISDHMRGIYHRHDDKDPDEMLSQFQQKYSNAIQESYAECSIPDLTAQHFFDQCSKKHVDKASGLDQWRYNELRHLPVCGWQPFLLVALVAEAGGGWPQVIRCISLT